MIVFFHKEDDLIKPLDVHLRPSKIPSSFVPASASPELFFMFNESAPHPLPFAPAFELQLLFFVMKDFFLVRRLSGFSFHRLYASGLKLPDTSHLNMSMPFLPRTCCLLSAIL